MSVTKKLLDAYKNTYVNLNGRGISDIIIMDSTKKDFKNMMTGASSDKLEDVIRPRKRFVIFDIPMKDKESKLPPLYGYYLWHDKENDILFMCTAVFKESKKGTYRWEQQVKACISKEDGIINVCEFMADLEKRMLIRSRPKRFDIAGQTIVDMNNQSGLLISDNPYSVGSKNAAFEFGGGKYNIAWNNKNHPYLKFSTISMLLFSCDIFFTREIAPIDSLITFGKVRCFNNTNRSCMFADFEKTEIPIPVAAKKKMNYYTKCWTKDIWFNDGDEFYFNNTLLCFAIIQNVNGTAVFREFEAMVDFTPRKEDVKFRLVETKRVYLGQNKFTACDKIRDMTDAPVVWCDDMKGTVIEHTDFLIRPYIEMMDKELKEIRFTVARYNASCEYSDRFAIDFRFATYVAAYIGTNRDVEAVHSALTTDHAKKSMYEDIVTHGEALAGMKFGEINKEAKTLNGILRMPKGMFEYLERTDNIYIIADVKNMFAISDEIYEYFMNMNKEDVKTFVDKVCILTKTSDVNASFADFYMILPTLFERKGVKNWNKYVDFIFGLSLDDILLYKQYIRLLGELTGEEITENIKWNVKDEELKRTIEELEIYIAIEESKDCANGKNIMQQFEEKSSEWKKYLYENGEYKIVCPKDPKDLVIEGRRLSHCLKDFITIVGSGNTTILFIRKAKQPDVPYFTLEIRNKEIRQCHGFANSNVEPDSDLDKFLKAFCKEKEIAYALGGGRLGI